MKRDALIFLYGAFCWWLACALAGPKAVVSSEPTLTAPATNVVKPPAQFPSQSLLDALAFVESSNNPRAVSPAGASGLFQFMQPTWEDHMSEPYSQAFNPVTAEEAAIKYLDWIRATLEKWRGFAPDVIDVLACWEGGIGRYKRREYDLARMPESTQQFVARVVSRMRIHDN